MKRLFLLHVFLLTTSALFCSQQKSCDGSVLRGDVERRMRIGALISMLEREKVSDFDNAKHQKILQEIWKLSRQLHPSYEWTDEKEK